MSDRIGWKYTEDGKTAVGKLLTSVNDGLTRLVGAASLSAVSTSLIGHNGGKNTLPKPGALHNYTIERIALIAGVFGYEATISFTKVPR